MPEAVLKQIDTQIGGVPAEHVTEVWSKVEPILQRVVVPLTGFKTQHVLDQLLLRKWQLWVIGNFEAVTITQIEIKPLGNVLWVRFMAGDGMHEWLDDWIKVQDEFARHNECVAVEFSSPRKGWDWMNEKYPEFDVVQTTYRKEL